MAAEPSVFLVQAFFLRNFRTISGNCPVSPPEATSPQPRRRSCLKPILTRPALWPQRPSSSERAYIKLSSRNRYASARLESLLLNDNLPQLSIPTERFIPRTARRAGGGGVVRSRELSRLFEHSDSRTLDLSEPGLLSLGLGFDALEVFPQPLNIAFCGRIPAIETGL